MDEKEKLNIQAFELTAAIKEAEKKFWNEGKSADEDKSRDEHLIRLMMTVDVLTSEIAFTLFTISIFCTPSEKNFTTWFMDTMGKEMIQDIQNTIEKKVKHLIQCKEERMKKNG